MIDFDLEMQKALEADGEKLRQLTGEDHGPFEMLPAHSIDWQFRRVNAEGDEDTLDLTIYYDIEPYIPACVSGPADNWAPAEGGCVDALVAIDAKTQEQVTLTPEECAEVTEWIECNQDHNDRGGDPDAAYDAWRDEQ